MGVKMEVKGEVKGGVKMEVKGEVKLEVKLGVKGGVKGEVKMGAMITPGLKARAQGSLDGQWSKMRLSESRAKLA